MKYLLVVVVLAFCVVSPYGQIAPAAAEPKASPLANSKIRGRVVYEGSGLPVRRGLIGLIDRKNFENEGPAGSYVRQEISTSVFVLTTDNGEFEIANVAGGTYYPFVNVPNVLNPQSINQYFGNISNHSIHRLDEYFQRMVVDGVNPLDIVITVKRGAAISGSVLYSDGSPVVSARVRVMRQPTEVMDYAPVGIREVKTDDRGYYRLTELPPGVYFIEVSEPSQHKPGGEEPSWGDFTGSSELRTYYPAGLNLKGAEAIGLEWGQERSDVNVVIADKNLFKLSGIVTARDTRKPLAGISLTFQRISEDDISDFHDGNDGNRVVSAGNGTWSFKDLPKGKYRVEASPCGSYDCDGSKFPNYARYIKEIEISDADVANVAIEMGPGSSVSGTVSTDGDKELPYSVSITLADPIRKLQAYASSYDADRKDGRFQREFKISALRDASYHLSVYVGDDFYVESVRAGAKDVMTSAIDVKEGQEIRDVKIVLASDMGTVSGTVSMSKDTPAPFSRIMLVPVEPAKQKGYLFFFAGVTGPQGDFKIRAAPGEYFVTIPKRNLAKLSEEEWLRQAVEGAQKVTVRPNKTTTISISKSAQ